MVGPAWPGQPGEERVPNGCEPGDSRSGLEDREAGETGETGGHGGKSGDPVGMVSHLHFSASNELHTIPI